MRTVLIKKNVNISGNWTYVDTDEVGKFIKYGLDYQEFESGPGNYTSAIVEMPDGTVRNLPLPCIRFIE